MVGEPQPAEKIGGLDRVWGVGGLQKFSSASFPPPAAMSLLALRGLMGRPAAPLLPLVAVLARPLFYPGRPGGGSMAQPPPRRIPELKETRAWVPARSTGQKDLGGVPPNPQRGGPAPPWLGRGDLPPLAKRPAVGSPRGPWAGPGSPRGAAPPAGGRPVRGRWAARVWTSMAMDGAMGMGGDPKSADGGGVDNVTTRNGNTGNKTKHRKQKEQK